MIKYVGTDITFQEVPGEVSLTILISNCQHRCEGCHSPQLREDIGDDLVRDLPGILERYKDAVTCVCFMGTGNDPCALRKCAEMAWKQNLKTAVYCGEDEENAHWVWLFPTGKPDYIKFGPYIQSLGGLDSPHTNQSMVWYNPETRQYEDITYKFQKRKREEFYRG